MVRGFNCDSAWLSVNSRINSLTSGLVECEIISNSSPSWNKVRDNVSLWWFMCVDSICLPVCSKIWHITRWCLIPRWSIVDKSMLGWHCCGVISCVVHQFKYLSLCLVAWYLHFSCMTLFVICCSVLSFAIGLSV